MLEEKKGVTLTSFEKTPESGIVNDSFTSPDHSGFSSSDNSPVKSSPIKGGEPNDKSDQTSRNEDLCSEKYKRISQLAEVVFGDTIIQNSAQAKRTRSVESVSGDPCSHCLVKNFITLL